MAEYIFIKSGHASGEIHPLSDKSVTVGRGESCEIRLTDPYVSRQHFKIEPRGNAYFLVDLGSSNCTVVNSQPAKEKQMQFGDEILVGSTRLIFLAGTSTAVLASEITSRLTRLLSNETVQFDMVGNSAKMKQVHQTIAKVSPLDTSVLITGESGVGKELVAQAIHRCGPRSAGPFIAVNCAAIPREMMESELFGHEKGAFTGASALRIGKFELADGGTLLLDEIGEMPLEGQAKLLRVLEQKTVTRIGGNNERKVNVRVIASTNRALQESAKTGQFRQDLLFRLDVVNIHVPPLRERKDDIRPLSEFFLHEFKGKVGRRVNGISAEALKQLSGYEWPGNVRELKNVIERAVIMGSAPVLEPDDFRLQISAAPAADAAAPTLSMKMSPLDDVIKQQVEQAMFFAAGNKSKAADLLKIPRSSLYDLLSKYGLN